MATKRRVTRPKRKPAARRKPAAKPVQVKRKTVQAKRKKTFKQGYYVPTHPEKYIGDVNKIVYRSSWERAFNEFLDNNTRVLRWASEEIAVPYYKPTSNRANKIHNYFPDYYVEYADRNGELHKELIEVKPDAQTRAPTRVGKNKKTQLYEQINWVVNESKWAAAQQFCTKYGWKFRIVTEKHLFI